MVHKKVDRPFFWFFIILVVSGLFIFSSASLGLLARVNNTFYSTTFNQLFFGLFLGTIACFVATNIKLDFLKKYAFFIFAFSTLLMFLVFVPHIGFASGGAKRWILIGPLSFQPAELYKLAFVIYLATWISNVKGKIGTFKFGLIPFVIITTISAGLLFLQPDTDTFFIIFFAGLTMYVVGGCRLRDIGVLILLALLGFGLVYVTRPYIRERVNSFIHPSSNSLTSSYQLQQSQIAIGSGEIFGKGFGQSVQKFNFLPEPTGDSIFAVAAEEFGFIGSSLIIILFLLFALRGLRIAMNTQDSFGRLLVIGLVILIISGSYINIASMLGVLPLSGTPLLFVSHGGTALLFAMLEAGLILNVSRYQKTIR